jgi:uncharacterized protein
MKSWLEGLFGTEKPVIAMAHIPALPGTPRYNQQGGMEYLIDQVRPDVEHLVQGGVNAIMFSNEDDRPYVLKAGIEQIAAMTRVITELAPKNLTFGANFMWDPYASIAIAHATGAKFVREVFSGVFESDMGIWAPSAGDAMRFRSNIGASNIRVFYNIVPEFASSLGIRSVTQRAKSIVIGCLPDVILVSGLAAGIEPDFGVLEEVKKACDTVPVFLNTGAKAENIASYLRIVDGVIVGSSLKVNGETWNQIDPARVDNFMKEVIKARNAG